MPFVAIHGKSEWDFNCQWLVAISKLVCGSVKWWDQVESSLDAA